MLTKLLEIDTNGGNASDYTQNLELYDLITPNIVFLVDCEYIVYMVDKLDWEVTRRYFHPCNNGHYICDSRGPVVATQECTHLAVKVSEGSYANTLSQLCDELAEEYNIQSWIRKFSKVQDNEGNWYWIPNDLIAEFTFTLETFSGRSEAFENKYREYRTMDDADSVPEFFKNQF